MPISQARIVDWDCRHCGEVFSRLSWLAIDAKERPDLRGQLVGIAQDHCPICERVIQRTRPLLVLRLGTAASLIVARDSQDQRDPLDTLGEVVSDVQRALSDARLTVPGPALLLSFRGWWPQQESRLFTTLRSFSLVGVAATTATALLLDGAPDSDHNIEDAIEFGRLAASIAESHPELVDLPGRVAVLTNLSAALLNRRQGDPDWKLAQAES